MIISGPIPLKSPILIPRIGLSGLYRSECAWVSICLRQIFKELIEQAYRHASSAFRFIGFFLMQICHCRYVKVKPRIRSEFFQKFARGNGSGIWSAEVF